MNESLTLSSPAKINVFLAVTGRRADGFHELVSVVAPLAWGDELEVRWGKAEGGSGPAGVPEPGAADGGVSLECDGGDELPVDGRNLVVKAAAVFRAATGWSGRVRFRLTKRIPVGAGLGGGSSNAAAALRALNCLAGEPLDAAGLAAVAAEVGSDCALFLHEGPVVMRGRGERVEPLGEAGRARLRGRSVLVFKPAFGIATAWAYRRLAEMAAAGGGGPGGRRAPAGSRSADGAVYLAAEEAEERLGRWLERGGARAEELVFNTLERPAFLKFPALPALLGRLRRDFGLVAGMSGSGSAGFAFLRDDAPVGAIAAAIREAWGESAFVVETRVA